MNPIQLNSHRLAVLKNDRILAQPPFSFQRLGNGAFKGLSCLL